jgi:hypothetical protein
MRDRDVVAVLQQMPGICFQSCERQSAEEWVHIYAWIVVMNPERGRMGYSTRTRRYGDSMYHVVLMEDSVVIRKRNHHYCGLEEVVSCIVLE